MDKKTTLLDDSSDSEIEFQINKSYAENYEKWRKKEEHQKLKDKYGDDLSSSSESEEEEEPIIEKDFLKTLSLLKSKDPQIYDENVNFFNETPKVDKGPKEKKIKPLYWKDYERKCLLETNGELSEEETPMYVPPTYDEEQEELKKSFKTAVEDCDSEDDNLLQVRDKDKKQQEKEEADYIQWLKGAKHCLPNEDHNRDLKFLRDYWNDPNLEENEQFLKEYILNKKFTEDDKSNYIPTYDDITNDINTLSDDEKLLEKQEVFEHKYNFRFEEPDTDFIKQYPRTIGDSLRKKDNKRKVKREEYQERKRQEKELKREEIKRLKALMRKEIEEKLGKIKNIAGNDKFRFEDLDIEGDFDPQEHDKKMKELFNEDYYNVEEIEKPDLPSSDEFDEDWDNWTGDRNEGNNIDSAKGDEGPYCEDPEFNMDADYDPTLEFQKQMIASSTSKKKRRKSKFACAISKVKPAFDPSMKSFEEYFDKYYKLDCEDIIDDLPVRYKYREVVPNNFGLSIDEILLAKDKELNRWCSIKKACQYRPKEDELYDVQAFQKKAQNEASKKKIFFSLQEHAEEPNSTVTDKPKKKKRKKSKKKHKTDDSTDITESQNTESHVEQAISEQKTNVSKNIETNTTTVPKPSTTFIRNTLVIPPNSPPKLLSTPHDKDDQNGIEQNKSNVSKKRKRKKKKKTNSSNVTDNSCSKKQYKQDSYSQSSNNHKEFKSSESTNSRMKLSDTRLSAYGINPKRFKKQVKYFKNNNH